MESWTDGKGIAIVKNEKASQEESELRATYMLGEREHKLLLNISSNYWV